MFLALEICRARIYTGQVVKPELRSQTPRSGIKERV